MFKSKLYVAIAVLGLAGTIVALTTWISLTLNQNRCAQLSLVFVQISIGSTCPTVPRSAEVSTQ